MLIEQKNYYFYVKLFNCEELFYVYFIPKHVVSLTTSSVLYYYLKVFK